MENANQSKIQSIEKKLKEKLNEYGSIELVSNLAIYENHVQSFLFHNPTNPLGENPFLAYSLGLFLSNNNFSAREPHPNQYGEFLVLLEQYFDNFRSSFLYQNMTSHTLEDTIAFISQQQKISDDVGSHTYKNQKDDYYEWVFFPLDDYFLSKFGFSVKDAIEFADIFADRLNKHIQNKHKLVNELCHKAKTELAKQESAPLLKQYKENNTTPEQMLNLYASTIFLVNSKSILVINIDDYCSEQNISDKNAFRKYLNTFSCKLGEQFKKFEDPLSDNILFYKPIIKLDEDNFFLPLNHYLQDRLDRSLEFLLEHEKKSQSNIWNKFAKLKSEYLERKSFEFFSRVFPEKCVFKNLCYWVGRERMEIDLLVLYDNKIFIVESKSGNIPPPAKQEGRKRLQMRLAEIIKKAQQQATSSMNYIESQSKAEFWDHAKKTKLLEIDSTKTNYEFFFINVTLEQLSFFATDLKELEAFNFFQDGDKYPWSVYLYDLDIITDLLDKPIYFIHYLEQRLAAQKQNILHTPLEINLLGYYLKSGNFYNLQNGNMIALPPVCMDNIEKYHIHGGEKPRLTIPENLEKLLLNMQRYNQKDFTKITSLLLDFPLEHKRQIAKKIENSIQQTKKTKNENGFTIIYDGQFKIGFSYFTANTMKDFCKYAVKRAIQRKQEHKITRWAVIGRNISDKKNYATFFIYYDNPEM